MSTEEERAKLEEERAETVIALRQLADKIETDNGPHGLFLTYTDGENFGGDAFVYGIRGLTLLGAIDMRMFDLRRSLWDDIEGIGPEEGH